MWGGDNHHPLSENRDFSATKYLVDLRPVCKLEFVPCGPVENNRALYLSQFNCGSPTKFENSFFQIGVLRFLTIFDDFRQNIQIFKKSQGMSLKAMGLIFWILALHMANIQQDEHSIRNMQVVSSNRVHFTHSRETIKCRKARIFTTFKT